MKLYIEKKKGQLLWNKAHLKGFLDSYVYSGDCVVIVVFRLVIQIVSV